jgi:hypothetical protein
MELNKEREAFLIENIAFRRNSLAQVREDYNRMFDQSVSGEQIWQFVQTNKAKIEAYARRELNNVRKEPLAHCRNRLSILYEMVQSAMVPKVIKSYPIHAEGKEVTYETETAPDYSAVDRLIRTAQNEEFFNKKVFLEIKKMDLLPEDVQGKLDSGFEVITINDGLKTLEDRNAQQ